MTAADQFAPLAASAAIAHHTVVVGMTCVHRAIDDNMTRSHLRDGGHLMAYENDSSA